MYLHWFRVGLFFVIWFSLSFYFVLVYDALVFMIEITAFAVFVCAMVVVGTAVVFFDYVGFHFSYSPFFYVCVFSYGFARNIRTCRLLGI